MDDLLQIVSATGGQMYINENTSNCALTVWYLIPGFMYRLLIFKF